MFWNWNLKKKIEKKKKKLWSPFSIFIPTDSALSKTKAQSSSLSSPPQLLEGPNSSFSVVKSAREMCCAGQTQAALKELHNPLLNLQ